MKKITCKFKDNTPFEIWCDSYSRGIKETLFFNQIEEEERQLVGLVVTQEIKWMKIEYIEQQ